MLLPLHVLCVCCVHFETLVLVFSWSVCVLSWSVAITTTTRMTTTRSKTHCPLFGQPQELPKTQLPTNGDVVNYFRFLRCNEAALSDCVKDCAQDCATPAAAAFFQVTDTLLLVSRCVAHKVAKLWRYASLTTISTEQLVNRVRVLYDHDRKCPTQPRSKSQRGAHRRNMCYYEIKKHLTGKGISQDSVANKTAVIKYRRHSSLLFDIAHTCNQKRAHCECKDQLEQDLAFLKDQRSDRSLHFDVTVDKSGSVILTASRVKYIQRAARNLQTEQSLIKQMKKWQQEKLQQTQNYQQNHSDDDDGQHEPDDDDDEDYEEENVRQEHICLDNFGREAIATGVPQIKQC